MALDLLGVRVHEPDVVFTDLGLAILGAWLAWRLSRAAAGGPGTLSRDGAVVMGGLASAALFGAVFHAFFPARTATVWGFIAWMPVALSILVVAATLLELGLRILAPRLAPGARRGVVAVYALAFLAVVLLVDESFSSIVRFYLPALLLMLVAAARRAMGAAPWNAGWPAIAAGFTISVGGALMQQAEVSVDPVYFNHNAVYHVVQAVAVVTLYRGFRRAREAPASAHAGRTDPALRPR